MADQFPTSEQVRQRLSELGYGQMQELATASGVPMSTLSNIRNLNTKHGARLDTVRKFWPHLVKLTKKAAV